MTDDRAAISKNVHRRSPANTFPFNRGSAFWRQIITEGSVHATTGTSYRIIFAPQSSYRNAIETRDGDIFREPKSLRCRVEATHVQATHTHTQILTNECFVKLLPLGARINVQMFALGPQTHSPYPVRHLSAPFH